MLRTSNADSLTPIPSRALPRKIHTLPTELTADLIISFSKIGTKTTSVYKRISGDKLFRMAAFHLLGAASTSHSPRPRFQTLKQQHLNQVVEAFAKSKHQEPQLFDAIARHVLGARQARGRRFPLESLITIARNFVHTDYAFRRRSWEKYVRANPFELDSGEQWLAFGCGKQRDSVAAVYGRSPGVRFMGAIRDRLLGAAGPQGAAPAGRGREGGGRELELLSPVALIHLFRAVSAEEDSFGVDGRNDAVLALAAGKLVGTFEDGQQCGQREQEDCLLLAQPVSLLCDLLKSLEYLKYSHPTLLKGVGIFIKRNYSTLPRPQITAYLLPFLAVFGRQRLLEIDSELFKNVLFLLQQKVLENAPYIERDKVLHTLFLSRLLFEPETFLEQQWKLLFDRAATGLTEADLDPGDAIRARLLHVDVSLVRHGLELKSGGRGGGGGGSFPEHLARFSDFVEHQFLDAVETLYPGDHSAVGATAGRTYAEENAFADSCGSARQDLVGYLSGLQLRANSNGVRGSLGVVAEDFSLWPCRCDLVVGRERQKLGEISRGRTWGELEASCLGGVFGEHRATDGYSSPRNSSLGMIDGRNKAHGLAVFVGRRQHLGVREGSLPPSEAPPRALSESSQDGGASHAEDRRTLHSAKDGRVSPSNNSSSDASSSLQGFVQFRAGLFERLGFEVLHVFEEEWAVDEGYRAEILRKCAEFLPEDVLLGQQEEAWIGRSTRGGGLLGGK